MTRERWLLDAIIEVKGYKTGWKIPDNIRVSVGFPKRSRRKNHQYVEVWEPTDSDDKVYEIFISPEISDSIQVLRALTLALHSTGLENWQKSYLQDNQYTQIVKDLGPYPHASLHTSHTKKKQKSYLIPFICPSCTFRLWTTAKNINIHPAGTLNCPKCNCLLIDNTKNK